MIQPDGSFNFSRLNKELSLDIVKMKRSLFSFEPAELVQKGEKQLDAMPPILREGLKFFKRSAEIRLRHDPSVVPLPEEHNQFFVVLTEERIKMIEELLQMGIKSFGQLFYSLVVGVFERNKIESWCRGGAFQKGLEFHMVTKGYPQFETILTEVESKKVALLENVRSRLKD